MKTYRLHGRTLNWALTAFIVCNSPGDRACAGEGSAPAAQAVGGVVYNPPGSDVPVEKQMEAAHELIARIVPKHSAQIRVEPINTEDGYDTFEIETVGKTLVLRGNSGVAVASAFNWYLKYTCHCEVAWGGSQLNLPADVPPVPAKIRRVSPYKFRSYLNYCTFNYTMAWWDWLRWEKEIDLMALNGISMPLQAVGQEAVWLETFKQFGVSEEEMLAFFVGPAYSAWQWMTNIDAFGGPLTLHWIKARIALAKRILDRQRSLGMTPILQAFTGHVPKSFLDNHPQAKAKQQEGWCSFPGIYQLDPMDPVFNALGTTFIKEQDKLYGNNHLYAADPFHEGKPPVDGDAYLNNVGNAVFKTMTDVDPRAIWVKQSWSFREAILAPVPPERFIILDLDGARTWNCSKPFNGRTVAWGTLYNLGGRNYLTGSPGALLARCGQKKTQAPNVAGFATFDEGIELNPVVFDALYENAWRTESPNPDSWVVEYASRRYGRSCPEFADAWKLLLSSVYAHGSWYGSTLCAQPAVSLTADSPCGGGTAFPYDNRMLAEAWRLLLTQGDHCGNVPGYRFDLVNFGQQALANYATSLHQRLIRAYKSGNVATFRSAVSEFNELLADVNELTGTHEMFMLGKWLNDARSWGATKEEQDRYEYNARTLITLWSDQYPEIFDYATRSWNGLFSDFYARRWQMFFSMLEDNMRAGNYAYDDHAFNSSWGRPYGNDCEFTKRLLEFQRQWVKETRKEFKTQPSGDTVVVATRLCNKYLPRIKRSYELAKQDGYPPNQSYRYDPLNIVVKKTNITTGKPVRCNGGTEHQEFPPEIAVDGIIDRDSHWAAAPGPAEGRWLVIDLGENTMVDGATVWTYWDASRYYQYKIEISTDGLAWLEIVDFSKNTQPASKDGYQHDFNKVSTRFVRLRMLKNSANPSMHVVEFQLRPASKQ